MEELTKEQALTLAGLRAHVEKYGYPPSLQWLADYCGLVSKSTVKKHMDGLVLKGWVERDDGVARGVRIVDDSA